MILGCSTWETSPPRCGEPCPTRPQCLEPQICFSLEILTPPLSAFGSTSHFLVTDPLSLLPLPNLPLWLWGQLQQQQQIPFYLDILSVFSLPPCSKLNLAALQRYHFSIPHCWILYLVRTSEIYSLTHFQIYSISLPVVVTRWYHPPLSCYFTTARLFTLLICLTDITS